MKNKINLIIFGIIELFLYGIIIFDIFTNTFSYDFSLIIRLSATFVLAIFSVISFKLENKNNLYLVLVSLFMVGADYFLLFTNLDYLGIILFIIVQLFINLYLNNLKKNRYIFVLFSLGLILIGSIIYLLFNKNYELINLTNILALIYILISLFNIIFNLIREEKNIRKNPKMYLIIGMIFLLLCDINIGLYNLTNIYIFNQLEWLFYWFFIVSIYLTERINYGN